MKKIRKKCTLCGKSFIPNYRQSQNFCNNKCQVKKWYLDNIKHIKKYKNNWSKQNKEKIREKNRDYRDKNIEKVRIWAKKYYNKNKIKCNKKNKKNRLSNPIRYKAKYLAGYYIPLKSECEICGDVRKRLERHHWRYDKFLVVNTLCKTCHSIQHINGVSIFK